MLIEAEDEEDYDEGEASLIMVAKPQQFKSSY